MLICNRHARSCRSLFAISLASLAARPAGATTLRIAEYNIDCSDQDNNNAVSGANAGIPAVFQAMGLHHLGTNVQPVDVMTLTELLDTNNNSITSTTLPALVNSLNAIYGAGVYAYDTTPDPTSGGTQFNGPSGLIYDTKTVQVISAKSLLYSGNSSNSNSRAPMRYELQPIGYGSNADFYVYVSHMKSGETATDKSTRGQEATIIRNDEATLPANSSVLYTGDFNSAPPEAEFTNLTAAGQGQAFDPLNFTTSKQYFSESTDNLEFRDDYEMMTSNVLNDTGPLGYVSGSFQVFGNNGTTAANGSTNAAGNTSLSDLSNATTILNDLMQPFGSDHMPVVADYNLVGISPAPNTWLGGTFNWNNSAKWSTSLVPNDPGVEVKIDSGNATASAVTLNQNATVEDLTLDANDSLTISPGETLTIAGPNNSVLTGLLSNSGTLAITGGTTQLLSTAAQAGTFNVSSGATLKINGTLGLTSLTSNGATTLAANTAAGILSRTFSAISIGSAGAVTVVAANQTAGPVVNPNRTVLVTPALTVATTGTLNLNNNDMIVQGVGAAGLTNVSGEIAHGRNTGAGGVWTGTGITSSSAATTSNNTSVAVELNNDGNGNTLFSSFDGQTVTNTDVLVKYTFNGDANLDGVVNGSDYTLIDNSFNTGAPATWRNGDFNYDGVVNGDDYMLIDNSFNMEGSTSFATVPVAPAEMIATDTAQIFEASSTAVPEPGSLTLACVLTCGLLARRRR